MENSYDDDDDNRVQSEYRPTGTSMTTIDSHLLEGQQYQMDNSTSVPRIEHNHRILEASTTPLTLRQRMSSAFQTKCQLEHEVTEENLLRARIEQMKSETRIMEHELTRNEHYAILKQAALLETQHVIMNDLACQFDNQTKQHEKHVRTLNDTIANLTDQVNYCREQLNVSMQHYEHELAAERDRLSRMEQAAGCYATKRDAVKAESQIFVKVEERNAELQNECEYLRSELVNSETRFRENQNQLNTANEQIAAFEVRFYDLQQAYERAKAGERHAQDLLYEAQHRLNLAENHVEVSKSKKGRPRKSTQSKPAQVNQELTRPQRKRGRPKKN